VLDNLKLYPFIHRQGNAMQKIRQDRTVCRRLKSTVTHLMGQSSN